jgi:cytochrome bd ubiquinol oxidase subunit II
LMLAGIVLRGSSFVFRAYSAMHTHIRRAYAYVFTLSSCLTPFLFGMILAALSDGSVAVSQDRSVNGYFWNWVNLFTLSSGMLTVALFAFLAAVYLVIEADGEPLRELFRMRGLWAGFVLAALELLAFALSGSYARELRDALLARRAAFLPVILAAAALALALASLHRKHFLWSRALAATHAGALILAWANAQYPFLVRPESTLSNSVLAENVVRDIFIACVAGAVVLFPSLGVLLYVFKDRPEKNPTLVRQ